MSYQQMCREHKFNREKLTEIKPLFTEYPQNPVERQECLQQMEPGTFFVCEGGGLPKGSSYWITVIRTEKKMHLFHSEVLESIEVDDRGARMTEYTTNPPEELWKETFLDIGPDNFVMSHYDYLELVLEEFWRLVFGKTASEMWCSGIIGAHGDKAYGYKSRWSDAGIPFRRGVLLFLLTYTKELGETPKHESCEWVIDNYSKYLPHIEAAEKEAGL